MGLPFSGLIPMVAEDQLQRVHEIGFCLFNGFAFREDIRQFLKGGCIPTFWRDLVDGSQPEVKRFEAHDKGNLVDGWYFFQ